MKSIITKEDLGIDQRRGFGRFVSRTVMGLLGFNRVNELVGEIDAADSSSFAGEVLDSLGVSVDCGVDFLNNIPKNGGCLVVSNFPHGLVDCLAILAVIGRRRKDVKFLITPTLSSMSVSQQFAVQSKRDSSYCLVKEAVSYLRSGGVLVVFPASQVGTYSKFMSHPSEGKWGSSELKFAKIVGVPIVPLYISGHASWLTMSMNKFFPVLNSLLYARELFKSKGEEISMSIGKQLNYNDIVARAKAQKFPGSLQSNIVTETVRGVLFFQSIKLLEGHKPPYELYMNQENRKFSGDLESAILLNERNTLRAFFVNNDFAVLSGDVELMRCRCESHFFNTVSSSSNMGSFTDFEFNHKHLTKHFKSCLEFSDVYMSSSMTQEHIAFIEDSLRSLLKYHNVEAIVSTIRGVHTKNNILTSAFVYFLEHRYVSGTFHKAIMARGIGVHSEYVSRTLRREVMNFYSPVLFAHYGSQIENLEVSPDLLSFLSLGCKVGSVSTKSVDESSYERSYLVVFK